MSKKDGDKAQKLEITNWGETNLTDDKTIYGRGRLNDVLITKFQNFYGHTSMPYAGKLRKQSKRERKYGLESAM